MFSFPAAVTPFVIVPQTARPPTSCDSTFCFVSDQLDDTKKGRVCIHRDEDLRPVRYHQLQLLLLMKLHYAWNREYMLLETEGARRDA